MYIRVIRCYSIIVYILYYITYIVYRTVFAHEYYIVTVLSSVMTVRYRVTLSNSQIIAPQYNFSW